MFRCRIWPLLLVWGVAAFLFSCNRYDDLESLERQPVTDHGGIMSGEAPVVMPRSDDELRGLLVAARKQGYTVRIRGAAHSFAGFSVPRSEQKEVILATGNLSQIREFDPESATLIVGSGLSIHSLRAYITEKIPDFFLPVYPDAPGPSVGGFFLAGGVNPSSFANSGFWNWVESVELMDGLGKLHHIRSDHPDFFWLPASSGHLGIIVSLSLRLKKKFPEFDRQKVFESFPVERGQFIPMSERFGKKSGIERVFSIYRDGLLHQRIEGDLSKAGLSGALRPQYNEDPGNQIKWFNLLPTSSQFLDAFTMLQELSRHLPSRELGIFYYKIAASKMMPPLLFSNNESRWLIGVWYRDQPVQKEQDLQIAGRFEQMRRQRRFQRYFTAELLTSGSSYADFLSQEKLIRLKNLKKKYDPECILAGGLAIPGVCRSNIEKK